MEERSDSNNNDPVDARNHTPSSSSSRGKSGLESHDARLPASTQTPSRLQAVEKSTKAADQNSKIEHKIVITDNPVHDDVRTTIQTTTSTSGTIDSGTPQTPPSRKSDVSVLNHTAARKCYYCGKKFIKLGDFRLHLLSHLGKKAYKCKDCGRRFRVKSNLLFHQHAAHGQSHLLDGTSLLSPNHGIHRSRHSQWPSRTLALTPSAEVITMETKGPDSGGESSAHVSPQEVSGRPEVITGSSRKQGANGFSPHSSTGSGGSLERELSLQDEFILEYPSQFPGLKHQISIKNETVLITRLDGTNVTTGEKTSLFKCHMCGKVYNFLSKLQCHLSLHFERHMTLYQCTYCDAHFKFKTLLLQHLRTTHGVHVSSRSDIPDIGAISPESESNPVDYMSSEQGNGAQKPSTAIPNVHEDTAITGGERVPSSEEIQGSDKAGSGNEDSLGSEDFLVSSNGGQYYPSHGFPGGKPLYDKVNGLYICQFCNKSFDRLFSLHRHERVHTGYKPCYCTYCGRGFSEPRNLRHHMIRFHSDGSQIHLIKRMRKKPTVDSGLSRTSQRLPLVTPEMIAKVNQAEASSMTSNVEPKTEAPPPRSQEAEPSTSFSRQSPIVVAPQPRLTEPPAKKLASEIREKESLDDDVTVVIPADPPQDTHTEAETPKSTVSDTTSWSGNMSEGDTDGSLGPEILSAPVKSIMGHHNSFRTSKRKHSTPTQASPPRSQGWAGEQEGGRASGTQAVKEEKEEEVKPDLCSLASAHHHFMNTITSAAASCSPVDLKYHPTSTPMSLPFSPLSISTFVNPGLAGLMPSSIMSPLGQAALFGQHGLTSPNMIGQPLPFPFPPLPSALAAATTASVATTTGKGPASSSATTVSPGLAEMEARAALEDYPGWMGKGGSRGSSLSRTHSRLYVVNKPVKREEVCKPTVLADGRTVYRCSYCNKDFCTFSDVNRHMDFHEDIRPYKCKFCDYYARTNSQLKVHMMRHQGIREFHCKLCNYKGVTQSDLNRHMKSQIHMMKARNECSHCGEGFVSPMNLEKHYHEKHFSHYEQLAQAQQTGATK